MAASFITEKDASDSDVDILTELFSVDKHAVAGVIYVNGSIVATANPFPVTDTGHLNTQVAISGSGGNGGATAISKKPGQTPGATDLGVNLVGIRTDAFATVSDAVGKWTPIRVNSVGGMGVDLTGAIDSSTDSIYVRPYGQGGTPATYSKRFTTTAGEIAIAAPGAGNRIVITNCRISCRSTVAGQISVFEDTDGGGDVDASEKMVADDNYAPTAALPTGSKSGPLHIVFTANKPCYVLSSAAINFTLMLDYFVEAVPV